MITTLGYFIIALLLLVLIHEYGHYLVARLCGVKILRFSFGFGKVLASRVNKHGTEFVWSLWPLGGYVKMLDESEGEVPDAERHLAFNNQSLLARTLIVVAGPLFNFLFAFFAIWLTLVIGSYALAPIIAKVKPGSIAALSGLSVKEEIIALNDKPISSWRDFQYAMVLLNGSGDTVILKVKSLETGEIKMVPLPLANWKLETKKPDILESLGLEPFVPQVPPIVGEIIDNSPAQKAGMQVADQILAINGKAIDDWFTLVELVKKNPNRSFKLTILRHHQQIVIPLVSISQTNNGIEQGFVGMRSQKIDWPEKWLRYERSNPLTAIKIAFVQTNELIWGTFTAIGRFVTGKLSVKNLSGPVGIAQGAGESGRSGFISYLSFLALISISIGVLNLLPIPLLDGGHLLFFLIEFIIRRPLSDEMKSIGLYLGLTFLITIMAIAISNDISRISG